MAGAPPIDTWRVWWALLFFWCLMSGCWNRTTQPVYALLSVGGLITMWDELHKCCVICKFNNIFEVSRSQRCSVRTSVKLKNRHKKRSKVKWCLSFYLRQCCDEAPHLPTSKSSVLGLPLLLSYTLSSVLFKGTSVWVCVNTKSLGVTFVLQRYNFLSVKLLSSAFLLIQLKGKRLN